MTSCSAQHAPETAPDGSPGRSALVYGTDPQADTDRYYGEQCADTDGMALSRDPMRDVLGPNGCLARRTVAVGIPLPASDAPQSFPARALRPLSRCGGLHCGPF